VNSDLVDQLGAYRSVLEGAMDEADSIGDASPSKARHPRSAPQEIDEPIVVSLTDSKPRRRSWKALAGLVAAAAFLAVGLVLTTGDDKGVVDVTVDRRVTDTAVAEPSTTEAVGVSESTIDTVLSESNGGSVEQRRIEDAAFFRLGVMNQSFQVHLSLSDYAQIRDEVCAGAVNRPSELVELSRRWGLAGLVDEEQRANRLWLAARISCPEAFDDQDFTKGPPFTISDDELVELNLTSPPPAAAQVAFVDVSILDDSQWEWHGDQMVLLGTTTLSPEETIDHFLEAFSDPWTVNEVLGPVVDFSGSGPLWSMDISGEGFTGVVDVTDDGVETFVVLAVIDGVYPLAAG